MDHNNISDHQFEFEFANATLDPKLFTHEAHLRLAWIHIKQYGVDEAIKNICAQLIQYTESLGARSKYNETVTIAAVRAVYHFMLRAESVDFQDFITRFPRLKTHFRELLGQHYSSDIFSDERAKEIFVEPDLLPFD